MSKFTSGEWKANGINNIITDKGDLIAIAIFNEAGGEGREETKANARLIAKAPKMLELLENMEKHLTGRKDENLLQHDDKVYLNNIQTLLTEIKGE